MSLRAKVVVLLSAVVILYAGLDFVLQRLVVFHSFAELERSEAEKDVQRAILAIQREIHHLDRRCEEWAAWDETRRFVEAPDEEYVRSNLGPEALRQAGLQLLYVCDLEGKVVWGRILEPAGERDIALRDFPRGALARTHPLLSGRGRGSGLWMTERGPMLVSSKPIQDGAREEPRRGTLVLGRFLGEDLVSALVQQTGVEFQVWPVQADDLPEHARAALDEATAADAAVVMAGEDGSLRAYLTISDALAAPALLVGATIPREITAWGEASLRYALLSTVAAGFLVMLALLVMLQRTVLRPLAALTDHAVAIGRDDETAARLGSDRKDEIGVLSREFDSMMEKLSLSRAALVKTARAAGMSEVATAVLHNVGNVLNSVNVSASLVAQKARSSSAADLSLAMRAVEESAGDLAAFLERDPRGKHLYPLLRSIAGQMAAEQAAILGEVKSLTEGIEHIRALVAAQQGYAGRSGVIERVGLASAIESALTMTGPVEGFEVRREVEDLPPAAVDRHRLTEILVNVIRNARDALRDGSPERPRIVLRLTRPAPGRARIEVEDNGVGIPSDDLARVFNHGFTTKKDGHGFGLHSSANAAVEMGGTLSARSDGPGRGASFVLELPVREGAAERAVGVSA